MSMRIAVYCSARQDIRPEYQEAATIIGRLIGTGGHTLIYGGLALGLMDTVSRSTKENGGKVVGIVPVTRTISIADVNDETILVADLNERKAKMITLADAFIALPGGYGTLDELMSTLAFLKFTSNDTKPIIVANIGGLFTPLVQQLRHLCSLGLMENSILQRIHVADSANECWSMLEQATQAPQK